MQKETHIYWNVINRFLGIDYRLQRRSFCVKRELKKKKNILARAVRTVYLLKGNRSLTVSLAGKTSKYPRRRLIMFKRQITISIHLHHPVPSVKWQAKNSFHDSEKKYCGKIGSLCFLVVL